MKMDSGEEGDDFGLLRPSPPPPGRRTTATTTSQNIAASMAPSSGVTNPLLPRSLGLPGKSRFGKAAGEFKSRFLPKHQKKSKELDGDEDSNIMGNGVNYSSENGMLTFTIGGGGGSRKRASTASPTRNSTRESLSSRMKSPPLPSIDTYSSSSNSPPPPPPTTTLPRPTVPPTLKISRLRDDDTDDDDSTLSDLMQKHGPPPGLGGGMRRRNTDGGGGKGSFRPSLPTIGSNVVVANAMLNHNSSALADKDPPKSYARLSSSIREFMHRTDPKLRRSTERESLDRSARASSLAPYTSYDRGARASSLAPDSSSIRASSVAPSYNFDRSYRASSIAPMLPSSSNDRSYRASSITPSSNYDRSYRASSLAPPPDRSYRASSITPSARDEDLEDDDFRISYGSRPLLSRFGRSQSVTPASASRRGYNSYSASRDPMDKSALPKSHWMRKADDSSSFSVPYRNSHRAMSIEPEEMGLRWSRPKRQHQDYSLALDYNKPKSRANPPPEYSSDLRPRFSSLEEECNWILSGRGSLLPPPSALAATNYESKKQNGFLPLNKKPIRNIHNNSEEDEDDTLNDISGDEVEGREKNFGKIWDVTNGLENRGVKYVQFGAVVFSSHIKK